MKKIIKILVIILIIAVIGAIIILKISHDKKTVICIDAGHGGSDVGAVLDNRYEKNDTLKVAKLVKKYLSKENVKVVMTRDEDKSIELKNRCKIANRNKADVFVSIHRNSAESGNGIEIWANSGKRKDDTELATKILDKLKNTKIQENRGIKYGTIKGENTNYYVLEHTNMPSCLIELGFITDKKDNSLLDKNIDDYAKAIAQGILEYMN